MAPRNERGHRRSVLGRFDIDDAAAQGLGPSPRKGRLPQDFADARAVAPASPDQLKRLVTDENPADLITPRRRPMKRSPPPHLRGKFPPYAPYLHKATRFLAPFAGVSKPVGFATRDRRAFLVGRPCILSATWGRRRRRCFFARVTPLISTWAISFVGNFSILRYAASRFPRRRFACESAHTSSYSGLKESTIPRNRVHCRPSELDDPTGVRLLKLP